MFRQTVKALSVPLVNYARLIMTDDANYHGNCHGGTTLKLCEGAGFIAASQFCNFEHEDSTSKVLQNPPTIVPALARISDVTFLTPMYVGELAKLTAKPIFTSKHSVDVMVEVWAENLLKRHVRKTNTAVLTYVGTDLDKWTAEGKVVPCEVPVYKPTSVVDKVLYQEMKEVYESRKRTLASTRGKQNEDPYVVMSPRTSTLVQVLHPGDCWSSKFATGGAVMKVIDNCAGISTLAQIKMPTVTISIEGLSFRYPAKLGDVLYVHATPVFAASKSLDVVVHVEIARFGHAERITTTSGKLTYVAVDSNGKPITVPPIIPETEQEKRAHAACKAAYERRKAAACAAPKNKNK